MTLKEFAGQISVLSCEEYFEKFPEIDMALEHFGEEIGRLPEEKRGDSWVQLERIAETMPAWAAVHVLSFCMVKEKETRIAGHLLEIILKADGDDIGEYNKLSHYWQMTRAIFAEEKLRSSEVQINLAKLYRTLLDAFFASFGVSKRIYIPVEERNENLVFVFSSQVLGLNHAPTKTLLDRCYVLKKILHKEVQIINTAMFMTAKGRAPFYNIQEAQYMPELSGREYIEFKGERFAYYQCPREMPDLQAIADVLDIVITKKPGYMISIGGNDICADICGRIVPEITVGTVFSSIAVSGAEWQITAGGKLSETDEECLKILGVEKEKIKNTVFTFSFKEQNHTFTRPMLGLPEGNFLIAVVGWRLTEEIADEFLQMLVNIVEKEERVAVVFIGRFTNYWEKMLEYPILQKKTINLGEQEDVLAVMDCMNLYINPKRQGGGSSVAEALYKGVPAITLSVGDVAVAAGREFWVDDYQTMMEQIHRYVMDDNFYAAMSEKAKKRAAILMDSDTYFGEAVREIESYLL